MPKQTYYNLPHEKKEEIYNRAIELFINQDFNEIGVRDIASTCDISVGAFYKYFDSKEEMYLHYYTEIEKKIFAFEQQAAQSNSTIWSRLDITGHFSEKELAFNRTWYKMPDHIYSSYYFDGYAFEVYASLKESLELYEREGKLKEGMTADNAYYVLITAMYNFLLYSRKQGWTNHETEITPAKEYFFDEILLPAILR